MVDEAIVEVDVVFTLLYLDNLMNNINAGWIHDNVTSSEDTKSEGAVCHFQIFYFLKVNTYKNRDGNALCIVT